MAFENLVAKEKKDRTGTGDHIAVIRAAKKYEREAVARLRATVKRITPYQRAREYMSQAWRKARASGVPFNRDDVLEQYKSIDPKAAASMIKHIEHTRRSRKKATQKIRAAMPIEQKRAILKTVKDKSRAKRAEATRNTVITCKGPDCGAQWSMIPGILGNKPIAYCSKVCKNAYYYRQAKARKTAA